MGFALIDWKIGYVCEPRLDLLFGEILLRFEELNVILLLIDAFLTSGFGLNWVTHGKFRIWFT
jgi:hypothetical protein